MLAENYLVVVCRPIQRFAEEICKTLGMAPKNTERFARIVAEAFSMLGVTQVEFNQMGGPSDTTLRKIMEGHPVGISTRTLKALDQGLGWTPGSAARTLAGGDPVTLSEDAGKFLNKIRHPVYAPGVSAGLDKGDKDLLSVLEEVLQTGSLPDNAQEQLERLRDDAVIEQFPKRYESLSRPRKLRVARYGYDVWIEQQQEGDRDDLETTPKSDAQASVIEGKEAGGSGGEKPARPVSGPEPPPKSRRRGAAEIQDRIPRPTKLSQRRKHPPSIDQ